MSLHTPSAFRVLNLYNLTADQLDEVFCITLDSGNQYDGNLGARISSVFVILIVSTAVTFFPVLAVRVKALRIPLYVYLFARYFGTGVIIATGFIHLLDPSYYEIGQNTCVGWQRGWRQYSWPPALALFSSMFVFFLDFAAQRYVEVKYGITHEENEVPGINDGHVRSGSVDVAMLRYLSGRGSRASFGGRTRSSAIVMGSEPQVRGEISPRHSTAAADTLPTTGKDDSRADQESTSSDEKEQATKVSFQQQIAAFLILEFGVIFHSVIIGLTLGTAGSEFGVLYIVIVFHQSFEGLGIGARLSAIPFPKKYSWMPWALCLAYGFTTPIAIAAGLGVRTTYSANSVTANTVAGILDGLSSGILIFTGFVELLARDFLFSPDRTNDNKQLTMMSVSVLLGAGIMALLGKWA